MVTKDCACFDSDAQTCYFLRYPNQMELDGRDYCECPCHQDYDYDDDMENTLRDAMTHLDDFERELGLY